VSVRVRVRVTVRVRARVKVRVRVRARFRLRLRARLRDGRHIYMGGGPSASHASSARHSSVLSSTLCCVASLVDEMRARLGLGLG
jgi:hypothetical protein